MIDINAVRFFLFQVNPNNELHDTMNQKILYCSVIVTGCSWSLLESFCCLLNMWLLYVMLILSATKLLFSLAACKVSLVIKLDFNKISDNLTLECIFCWMPLDAVGLNHL